MDGLDTIVVGLSGGSDSVALLILLHEIFGNIRAVHLHHGLRGKEADLDQEWCKAFCSRQHIPYSSSNLEISANSVKGESAETASRRLRINYWVRMIANKPGTALALGHHLDDKIENFLIRLFRGSNATGLTGLRAYTIIQGVNIIRPILCLEKKEIIEFLKEHNIKEYRQDTSNTNQQIYRNKIRLSVIPYLLEIIDNKRGLVKSLEFIEQDAIVIEKYVDKLVENVAGDYLPTETLLGVPQPLWSRFLRKWIALKGGENLPLRGRILKNLCKSLNRPISDTKRLEINKEFILRVTKKEINLEKKHSLGLPKEIRWEWQKIPSLVIPDVKIKLVASIVKYSRFNNFSDIHSEFLDLKSLDDYLIIRPRQAGDRMAPFGGRHEVRVKKLVSNAKLTPLEKLQLIIITNMDNEILWIPFVRRSNLGKVSNVGDYCLKLTIQPTNGSYFRS